MNHQYVKHVVSKKQCSCHFVLKNAAPVPDKFKAVRRQPASSRSKHGNIADLVKDAVTNFVRNLNLIKSKKTAYKALMI